MDDQTLENILNAFLDVMKDSSGNPEKKEQLALLKGLMESGYFATSRMPAPASITEIGTLRS